MSSILNKRSSHHVGSQREGHADFHKLVRPTEPKGRKSVENVLEGCYSGLSPLGV